MAGKRLDICSRRGEVYSNPSIPDGQDRHGVGKRFPCRSPLRWPSITPICHHLQRQIDRQRSSRRYTTKRPWLHLAVPAAGTTHCPVLTVDHPSRRMDTSIILPTADSRSWPCTRTTKLPFRPPTWESHPGLAWPGLCVLPHGNGPTVTRRCSSRTGHTGVCR